MSGIVLDASALLAFLGGEAGAEAVAEQMADAMVSAVNLSEVVAKLVDKGIGAEAVAAILAALPVVVVSVDEALALRAGALRAQTRSAGLSLGDRFCLALADREGAAALTADKAWTDAKLGIDIVLIR